MRYELTSELPAPADSVYLWHTRPGAFERLLPPWESVKILASEGPFESQRVRLGVGVGPARITWTAQHQNVTPGREFVDTQEDGPFAAWTHTHRFEPVSAGTSRMVDRIDYRLPGGALGNWIGGPVVRRKIARMMAYRHRVLRGDLEAHGRSNGKSTTMNVTVIGASGLVGSALVPFLTSGGHEVRRVGRSKRSGEPTSFTWDHKRGHIDDAALEGADAVVNLAGENIGQRWTEERKKALRTSRVDATRFLSERLAAMENPPSTLVCASAIGYYGDRGDEALTEQSARGTGMLAELCEDWEQSTQAARERGIRVVHVRFGIVLSPRGGSLAQMLPPFRFGVGGKLGDGKQFMSWVSIDDVAGAVHQALQDSNLVGPVNVVSPQPVRNEEFTRTLGRVLGRPTIFPVPPFALRTLFGEMADELLLSSARVLPEKLEQAGYSFRHPTLEGALRHLLGR